MERVDYVCPACSNTIIAPRSLAGRAAPCPKCRASVPCWPEPVTPAARTSPPPFPQASSTPEREPSRDEQRNEATGLNTGSSRAIWTVVVVGLFVALLVGLPVALKLGWFAGDSKRQSVQNAPEDWTHRELADHLRVKGIAVEVQPHPLFTKPGLIAALFEEHSLVDRQIVLVYLCGDARAAREQAGSMGDGAFAAGRFAIGTWKGDGKCTERIRLALK